MSLTEQRLLFSQLLARLLTWAHDVSGILVVVDEVKRGKAQAAWNAAHGLGIVESLHTEGLAVDLLVYEQVQGALVYQSLGTEPGYKLLGDQWKRLHSLARWGGDFSHPDWDHYSLAWQGRA